MWWCDLLGQKPWEQRKHKTKKNLGILRLYIGLVYSMCTVNQPSFDWQLRHLTNFTVFQTLSALPMITSRNMPTLLRSCIEKNPHCKHVVCHVHTIWNHVYSGSSLWFWNCGCKFLDVLQRSEVKMDLCIWKLRVQN